MAEAIEAFTRLNTEGVRMTPEQIFFALSYREGQINVGAEIDQIVEDVLSPHNYGDVSRTALLRVLLASMNKDIYGSAVDWRKLVEDEPELLRTALDACKGSLAAALAELHALGASSQRVLPYALQLVLFSEFFRAADSGPTEEQLTKLRQWFWVSAFSGAFMVGSSKRFNEAVEAARKLARNEDATETLDLSIPALPLPRTFHQRAARVRAFFLFLKSLSPLDPTTAEPVTAVLDEGFQDARQVFRRIESGRSRDLANRVLLGSRFTEDPVVAFQGLSEKSREHRETVLESHGIPGDAWQALMGGDAPGFIAARRSHLISLELKFMGEHGVTVPRGSEVPTEYEEFSDDLVDDADT